MSKPRISFKHLILLVLAVAAGWGGHRVYQRVSGLFARVRATRGQPAAPVDPDFQRDFVPLPSGIWFGKTEVNCETFEAFLNETRNTAFDSPQFVREAGQWKSVRPAYAVTRVSLGQARAFTQWYSTRYHGHVRLPSPDEWEQAARGGIVGAPYAWGWGDPEERCDFARPAPSRTALFAANGFGLFDMSGGVAEWCEPDAVTPEGRAPVLGGSWSDRDPAVLQPGHRTWLPVTYRDADVGFRLVLTSGP